MDDADNADAIAAGAGFRLPRPHAPLPGDIWTGLFVLALPQLPPESGAILRRLP